MTSDQAEKSSQKSQPSVFRLPLEQFMMRIGSMIFSKAVASLGTVEFAAHQVCMNIQSLTMMNGQVFSISSTSLTGQSLGKKRPDMAQAYTTRCKRCGMAIAITLGILFVIFGRPLSGLYTNDATCITLCIQISLDCCFYPAIPIFTVYSWQVHSVVPVIQSLLQS